MTYESNQDWATTMARISCITLQGTDSLKAYRHQVYRTETNDNQQWFEKHLHDAMGYKSSTVNDWGV